MAEEEYNESTTGLDDMSVLRELLHTIRGLSPVSSLQYELAEINDDAEAEVSYS